jgi:hypothetical protein
MIDTIEKISLQTETQRVFCEIELHPADHIVCVNWIGYQSLEDIERSYSTLLNVLNKNNHQYTKLLLDSSDMKGPLRYDGHWIADELIAPLKKAGVQKAALVVTGRIISEIVDTDVVIAGLQAKYFPTSGYAKVWLISTR